MSEEKEFQRAVELLPDKIVKGLKIVKPEDLQLPFLYHISSNWKIKEFTPMVSTRTMDGEDRSVPRICTGPSLLDCLIGYGAVYSDFSGDGESGNRADWIIYAFPFELAIRPSVKLLPDQRDSNEHWLITYSKDTRHYVPEKHGFLKMVGYSTRYIHGKMTDSLEFVCKVTGDQPVLFSNGVLLERGYYLLTVSNWAVMNRVAKDLVVKSQVITKDRYEEYNAEKVTMESLPPSAQW